MTLPARKSRRVISGSGWSNPLTHEFLLENATYLSVWADDVELTPGVDYSVSGVGDPAGYEVTITEPGDWTPEAWVLTVEYPIDQPSDVDQGGQFGQRFEEALDRLALGLQTLDDRVARSLKMPNTTDPDLSVEVDAAEPDSVLGWNGDGTRIENKGSVPQIQVVAGIAAEIVNVSNHTGSIVAVEADLTNIDTVAGSIGDVKAVGQSIANVNAVAGDLTNIDTVAGSIGDVEAVAPSIASVVTVAADIANVNAVAGDLTDVNTVAGSIGDVEAVAPSIASVVTVAADIANVNAVAGDLTDVNTVAGSIGDVSTVAGIDAAVTTVAASDTAIGTVASNIGAVNTASSNMAAIQAAPGAAVAAENARDAAWEWANEAEDVPVNDGTYSGYSSFHWAKKAYEAAQAIILEISGLIHAASPKSTPADNDELALVDSADGWSLKKLTWASLKATLKSYFDTLYAAVGHSHPNATTSASGFMSATDKSKLDGIEAGAQVNTVTSVAGKTGAVTLAKGDVGLGNVDNTSDANKPVSSAQAAAINAKVTKANDTGLGGFTATSKALPTSGTINLAPTDGNIQHCAKTGAVTMNAPTVGGVYTIIVEVHNTNATGTVTLSGFTKVDGDPFTSTSGDKFHVYITKTNSAVTAFVKALP